MSDLKVVGTPVEHVRESDFRRRSADFVDHAPPDLGWNRVRVTLGGYPPRVPTGPYVHALEHTVPQVEGSLRVIAYPLTK